MLVKLSVLDVFTKNNWSETPSNNEWLYLIYGISNVGFRPVKSPLVVSKFTFLRKFVELTMAKTPIYIISYYVNTVFLAP